MLDFEYGLCAKSVKFSRRACHAETVLRDAWANRGEFAGGGAGYSSVFTFPADFLREVQSSGTSGGYTGPCKAEFLHFDIDRPGNLHEAVLDAIKLVLCQKELGLTEQNIQIYFTGKKGFHIAVPIAAFGQSAKPSKQLHNHCKNVAKAIAKMAGIKIDMMIYDRVSLLRLPNTQHGKSGLYKIPLMFEELRDEDAAGKILARAEAPRVLTDTSVPPDEDSIPGPDDVPYMPPAGTIPMCEAVWEVATSRKKKVQPVARGTAGQQPTAPVSRATQNYIANGAPEGERAVGLFKAAADCTRHGWDEERVKAELTPVGLQSGLEEPEVERQICCGIEIVKKNEEDSSSASGKKRAGVPYGSVTTSQEIADAYIQHILQPGNRNLCYTPGEKGKGKWWKYTPLKGWFPLKPGEASAEIMRFVRKHMKAIGDNSDLSVARQNSILRNIQYKLTILPSDTADEMEENIDPTLWLTFSAEGITAEPAPGWVSCRTHLLKTQLLARRMAENKRADVPFDWNAPDIHEMLRPASSSLFARGKIPCAFNPTATAPRWCQFLNEACPEDNQQFMMMVGLSMTYIPWYNVFFVLFGPGGSGKSTAAEIPRALNRGNTCSISLGDLGKDFHEYPLTENRLNLVSDMEKIRKGERASRMEMIIKTISGKESKDTQKKYGDAETKPFLSLCVFTVNEFPEFEETTSAIARRMRLIRFPNVFYETGQQDAHLHEKLMAELEGIFSLSLIALGALLINHPHIFPENESAKTEKLEAIRAAHSILLFCDTHFEMGNQGDFVTSDEVMEAYNLFCDTNNLERLASKDAIPAIRKNFGLPDKPIRRTIGGKRPNGIAGIRFHSADKFIALNPCRHWESSGLYERNR